MSTPLRVGLLTPGFSASEADWCIPALLDLVRGLAGQADVRVFTLRYPHTRRPYVVHGARVTPLGAAQSRGAGRLLMAARLRAVLRREQRREPFDILHALWAHEPGALATWIGRALGVPVVVSVLGGELVDLPAINYGGQHSPLNRRLITRALGRATHVTVGSRFLADVARAAGRWDERWSVCPLGVETQRFHADGPRAAARAAARQGGAPQLTGEPALLEVASLVPVKDHATLLRAFALLSVRWPRAHLHLVGDGPLRQALDARARQAGGGVTFHGALPHHTLPAVYRQADLCVLSSLFESQCLAALEAVACGCPVAGTAVGALPELTPHVAAPDDVAGLAGALTRALEAPVPAALPPSFELSACLAELLGTYRRARSAARAGGA